MNEKISEIALRIWSIHPKDIDALGLNTRIEYYEMELEKFAELIVKECCKIIKEEENDALNTFRYMGDSPPGRDYISEIKKHFGINDERQD